MSGVSYLPVKGEYHDNFLTAQAAARGALDRERQPCLFDRLEWLDNLHRMALRDRAPMLLRAHEGEAEAWLPLMAQGGNHHVALANWYNFTWRPVFGGDYDEVTRMSLLRQLAATAKERTRRLTLAPVPDEDGSASQIAAAFSAAGWVVEMDPCDENHILRLNGRSFDRYWEGRPGQLKSTVKRKGKKGVVIVRVEREFSDESWHDYERVYARSWKPHEGSPEFLKQLAQQESVAGALRLGLAYIDGQPVAAQFWTVENGVALIHKLAHDERHLEFSPGTLLSAALFQHVIDIDRVEEIDFGTGSDGYKRDWMEDMRLRYRIDLFWPNHIANWPLIARAQLRADAPQRGLKRKRKMSDKVEDTVRALLSDVLGLSAQQVADMDDSTELFGALPELDSMAVAGLLTEMEDRLDIMIDDDEVDGELFATFGNLVAFAKAKVAE